MSKKKAGSHPNSFISPEREYGLLRAATPDGDVWLYASIPWAGALLDGADDKARARAELSLNSFFDALARMVPDSAIKYREYLKATYREFHLLTGSMPVRYMPPKTSHGTRLGAYQAEAYKHFKTRKQFAIIGVKLKPITDETFATGKKPTAMANMLKFFNNTAYWLGNGEQPLEAYLGDANRVSVAMINAGLTPMSQMSLMEREQLTANLESWWVSRAGSSSLPILAENNHLHFFPSNDTAAHAKRLYDDGVDCTRWEIPEEYPASICVARTSDFQESDVTDPRHLWIAQLMAVFSAGGANAIAASVRGLVEPSKVTEREIRNNARVIDDAIKERYEKDQRTTGEMDEANKALEYKRSLYSANKKLMPSTIINLSVVVCAAGTPRMAADALSNVPDIEFVTLMTSRDQLIGFKSMQVCSPFRLENYELHWTSTVVAGGGASSFARGGDDWGALLGLSEANRQPVYLKPTIAQDEDLAPFLAVIGKTGSGKTMALFNLVAQWNMMRQRETGKPLPAVYVNPKSGDDLINETLALGGEVIRLDKDTSDGMFDPLNVMGMDEPALVAAASVLSEILFPHGDVESEITVKSLLNYGVKHGAKLCGAAIFKAASDAAKILKAGGSLEEHGLRPNTIEVANLLKGALLEYSQMRMLIGVNNSVESLRLSDKLTLIAAGESDLIPSDTEGKSIIGRIQIWLLRMILLGAGTAMRGRDGVVALDEAWVFMSGGKSGTGKILKQMGRLARSMRYYPILATQKVQEFIDAKLEGAISRALLLALDDPTEQNGSVSDAAQAMRLLRVDDLRGSIRGRLSLPPQLENKQPNYGSMYHLAKTVTLPDGSQQRKNLRGSIAYFIDNGKPPLPVEIVLPPEFLKRISTNAIDKINRAKKTVQASKGDAQ